MSPSAAGPKPSAAIPERAAVHIDDTWNLAALYADADAWEGDFARLESVVSDLEARRGSLSAEEPVLAFLEADTQLDLLLNRLYSYAHMKADEDTANAVNQARETRIRATCSDVAARLSWARPELLSNDEETLKKWCDAPALHAYTYALTKLLRQKAHTLSPAEERILAGAGTLFGAPGEIYNLLTNADMTFPTIDDEHGNPRELSQGRFISFLQNRDRSFRKRTFEGFYDTYGRVRNTTAATLRNHVRMHNFCAATRHYGSAIEAALSPDHVPVSLYEALIQAVHDALPAFHDYIDLRRLCLGVDDLNMYDMYVPIVPEVEVQVPLDEAATWVIEACRPLGEDYTAVLQTAFTDRWIDRYENRGKRSGAYSGGCYDSLPYILLNYQGTLDDVFTLAHELGHSMHSYLANQTQPPQTAGYPIFIAEIASTANEALLLDYLLKKHADEPALRAYLLNHYCDGFRGTVYRQTMFAEFERQVHDLDEKGQPLTAESISDAYYALNQTYHGDTVDADRRIGREWSRIPHFYYNFYVYKYSTSFCASQVFAQGILADPACCEAFLGLLRAGGSADPLILVRDAGVDLTEAAAFTTAFAAFENTVSELAALLKKTP